MPVTTVKCGGTLLEQEIRGITKDSREVREGYVFFVTGGSKPYLSSALERKPAAVVSDELLPGVIPCLVVTDKVRLLLARMAAKFYGFPSRALSVTGITGTNGKTTITYLAESIVHAAGSKAGVIGTISYRYDNHSLQCSQHDARVGRHTVAAQGHERGRRRPCGDGGLVPCPGPGACRGRRFRLCHLYQPHPRPSRLSW